MCRAGTGKKINSYIIPIILAYTWALAFPKFCGISLGRRFRQCKRRKKIFTMRTTRTLLPSSHTNTYIMYIHYRYLKMCLIFNDFNFITLSSSRCMRYAGGHNIVMLYRARKYIKKLDKYSIHMMPITNRYYTYV